jgi:hypothetical protein
MVKAITVIITTTRMRRYLRLALIRVSRLALRQLSALVTSTPMATTTTVTTARNLLKLVRV